MLWMAWKTDKGSPVSPGQCSCTQVTGCYGCCAWLWLWTGWSPSVLPPSFWFGTIQIFSVPQHENNSWLGSKIGPWWWGHICSWGLFRGLGWELLNHIWMQMLQHRWKRCVDHRSAYVENVPHFTPLHHRIIVSLWTWKWIQSKEFHMTPYINIKGPCKSEDVPHFELIEYKLF